MTNPVYLDPQSFSRDPGEDHGVEKTLRSRKLIIEKKEIVRALQAWCINFGGVDAPGVTGEHGSGTQGIGVLNESYHKLLTELITELDIGAQKLLDYVLFRGRGFTSNSQFMLDLTDLDEVNNQPPASTTEFLTMLAMAYKEMVDEMEIRMAEAVKEQDGLSVFFFSQLSINIHTRAIQILKLQHMASRAGIGGAESIAFLLSNTALDMPKTDLFDFSKLH